MPPIGETLREARMRQRLDIADVEERTKIRAKYLRALENEEWGLLPGPTFVKTFLRTYAEVVGIDPYLLVEEYRLTEERGGDQPEFQLAPMPARDRRDRRDGRRGGRRPPPRAPRRRGGLIVGAAVAAIVVFLLVLGLVGGDDDPGDGGDVERATVTEAEPTPAERRQARAERRRERREAPPSGVRVRIVPAEATYVCIDRGPGTAVIFESTLDVARTFRDPRELRVNLGKRSATVTVNGERVAVSESAEPLALSLTRAGSTEIDSTAAPCA
jgi:cytoskeleton protein RodZ